MKTLNDFLNDLKKPGDFSLPLDSSYSINATQERNQRNFNRENLRPSYIDQEAMSKIFEKKQKYPFIYNSLPIKYINFYNCRIGVIYKYHKDYKNINNLINEDWQTFLNVLVNIGNCQRELIEAKIYYMDYKSENILYKGTDVKIIDLDIPNPNIYGYNNFDELISFERNARTPEGIRIIKERNERLPMESYGKLRIIIYPIIMNKLMHEHNYIPENDEKINNIVDQIYNQTIINCNCNGLLEIINKYIELNQTKSRTK